MAEIKHFRGEGGKEWRLELPLSEPLAEQVAKGLLVEVEPEKPRRGRKAAATADPEPTPEGAHDSDKPAE